MSSPSFRNFAFPPDERLNHWPQVPANVSKRSAAQRNLLATPDSHLQVSRFERFCFYHWSVRLLVFFQLKVASWWTPSFFLICRRARRQRSQSPILVTVKIDSKSNSQISPSKDHGLGIENNLFGKITLRKQFASGKQPS